MVATYTDSLRITKQGTGDNPNTWGEVTNEEVIELFEDAIAGVTNVSVNTGSNVSLSLANGNPDEARRAVLKLAGEPINDIAIIVPNVEKKYAIDASGMTGDFTVTVRPNTGTGVEINAGDKVLVYCDATNVIEMSRDLSRELAQINSEIASSLHTGDIKNSFATLTQSQGWLLCDGSTYDAATDTSLQALFDVIGTTFGGTSNSDFQVPDFRGRGFVGLDNMGGTAANRLTGADSLGNTGGSQGHTVTGSTEDHVLTVEQIPAHSHIDNLAVGGTNEDQWEFGRAGFAQEGTVNDTIENNADLDADHRGFTSETGGGQAHSHGVDIDVADSTDPWMAGFVYIKI